MDMPSTPDMATKVLGGDTPDKAAISSKGRLFEVCIGTEVHPVYDHQLHPQPAMLEKLCDEQDKQVHPSLSVKEPWLTP